MNTFEVTFLVITLFIFLISNIVVILSSDSSDVLVDLLGCNVFGIILIGPLIFILCIISIMTSGGPKEINSFPVDILKVEEGDVLKFHYILEEKANTHTYTNIGDMNLYKSGAIPYNVEYVKDPWFGPTMHSNKIELRIPNVK